LQPALDQFTIPIEELHIGDLGLQLSQAPEASIAGTGRGKRQIRLKLDCVDTVIAGPLYGSIGRAGINVNDLRRGE
jgi:hypothetical protein